jgi:predicted glutamine amidotransferase
VSATRETLFVCRLFGFRSALPSQAHRSLMEAENALTRQAMAHPDGWGIGWFVDDDSYVVKSHRAAHACERFAKASRHLTSQTFLVHVRRATVGTVDHHNAHPFRFGRWLFAHNGTVFGMEQGLREWLLQRIDAALAPLILGDTDSEHLFHYLLTAFDRAGLSRNGREATDAARGAEVLRGALAELDEAARERELERPIVNVLLTDGRLFLAHRAGMPLHMSTQKRFCPDAETCREPSKVCLEHSRPAAPVNHLLVASEPIGAAENLWETIADGATLALDPGFALEVTSPSPGWTAPEVPARFRRAEPVLPGGARRLPMA